MKNGYYISAYCCIDEEGCCLKAQIRHDQSIALWKINDCSVSLVRYWELERYTRKKQHLQPFISEEHFMEVLDDLLSEVDLSKSDIVEIWGMPNFIKSREDCLFAHQYGLPLHSIYHIFSSLIDTKKLFGGTHLVLALDGGPDNVLDRGFDLPNHYGAALFEKGEIITIESISSPAYLWAEASDKFLMREGTLMALAEACNCNCNDVTMLVPSFEGMWDIPALREQFEQVWSQIRDKELVLDERFTEEENRISCFMKIIQKVSRDMVGKEIFKIIHKYGIEPKNTIISMVGGFALNCPTNTWIMNRFGFKEFVSPPCVNDSGIALGIGLLNIYLHLGRGFDFDLQSAFWGHEENRERYECILDKYKHYIKNVSVFNIQQFVRDIEEYPICWFEGKSEIGPRALGHRSILSSATSLKMKNKLNLIKQREWWRPVAPMVLDSAVNEWFEDGLFSPYMLHALKIKSEKSCFVPAVLHLNDTARIQTLTKNDFLYNIMVDYYRLTGVPMICNTSLNDKGEPIINTYEELFNFALRKRIHVIYVEKNRIELNNHNDFIDTIPHQSKNVFDSFLMNQKKVLSYYSNVVIDEEDLDFYINHRDYFETPIIWLPRSRQKELIKIVRETIYENLSS